LDVVLLYRAGLVQLLVKLLVRPALIEMPGPALHPRARIRVIHLLLTHLAERAALLLLAPLTGSSLAHLLLRARLAHLARLLLAPLTGSGLTSLLLSARLAELARLLLIPLTGPGLAQRLLSERLAGLALLLLAAGLAHLLLSERLPELARLLAELACSSLAHLLLPAALLPGTTRALLGGLIEMPRHRATHPLIPVRLLGIGD